MKDLIGLIRIKNIQHGFRGRGLWVMFKKVFQVFWQGLEHKVKNDQTRLYNDFSNKIERLNWHFKSGYKQSSYQPR